MGFLSSIITAIYNGTHNFGLTIVISVFICYAITFPFKILSAKNKRAKTACKPEIQGIRLKYNASKIGVEHKNTSSMPQSVKKMSFEEREDAMANEIRDVYKKHGYHIFVGWIPGILTILFVIFLYAGIRASAPNEFWTLTFHNAKEGNSLGRFLPILAIMLCSSLLMPGRILVDSLKNAKITGASAKTIFLSSGISLILSLGVSIWIGLSVTSAIAVAISTFYVLYFIDNIIKGVIQKKARTRIPTMS